MTHRAPIDEPELLQRWAMDNREFAASFAELIPSLPRRTCDAATIERALAYPWARPAGSFVLRGGETAPLSEMAQAERDEAIAEHTEGRLPLLAIGSNGAPTTLARKFAHFGDADDRSALALSGRLRDFDVGFAAQPALYGSLPATLFPSPGTSVSASLLWVTEAQFAQLAWSELSYRLGRLEARFEVDEGGTAFDEVLVFVSRFGAFAPEGEPVAQAVVSALGRSAPAMTQEEALDAAAALALGPEAGAESLIRAIVEDLVATAPRVAESIHPAGRPFASDRWAPFGSG